MATVYIKDDVQRAIEKLTVELIVKNGRRYKEGEVLDHVLRTGLKHVDVEELSRKRD